MCDELYVVVSNRDKEDAELCSSLGKIIPGELRKKWLCQELQGFDNIHVILLDETNLPIFPNGWEPWSNECKKLVGKKIDFIYGGEISYTEDCNKWFPESKYIVIDPNRSKWPISATEVRENPLKHWDYIIGAARSFLSKKVLIAGTESCGKSTMTKKLAKMYYTSWSEEIGRYYSEKYLGGDESAFKDEDFKRIAYLQYENDLDALKSANKICFFDTDATTTLYYSEMYLGHRSPGIEEFIDPTRYDLVLFLSPDVKWVDDGLRFLGEQQKREKLHNYLRNMYVERGFKNIIDITGDSYEKRFISSIEIIDNLLGR
jgi:HTH-type transcriptional repressor of NAD biosynthesis genes